MYNKFAFLYDQFMHDAPYDKWHQFTEGIIQKREVDVDTIVDLGCGTGELTLRLTSLASTIIGVDQSETMLTVASGKNSNNSGDVQWIRQDIQRLEGFTEIDLFVSYCDVINYLCSKEELRALFSNVYASLRPGGYFIFDIHSLHHVETMLVNRTFSDGTDHFTYIWDCVSDKAPGEMTHYLTFFYRQAEGTLYNRFDEIHKQRTYFAAEYKELLELSGFDNIHFYRDFSIEKEFLEKKSTRIFIVAHKK